MCTQSDKDIRASRTRNVPRSHDHFHILIGKEILQLDHLDRSGFEVPNLIHTLVRYHGSTTAESPAGVEIFVRPRAGKAPAIFSPAGVAGWLAARRLPVAIRLAHCYPRPRCIQGGFFLGCIGLECRVLIVMTMVYERPPTQSRRFEIASTFYCNVLQ